MLDLRCCCWTWIALLVFNAAAAGKPTDPSRYRRTGDDGTTAKARFFPTRPGYVEGSKIRLGDGRVRNETEEASRQEFRRGRYAPRRPGDDLLITDSVRLPRLLREEGRGRFQPTRPQISTNRKERSENLVTVYAGYRRIEGFELPTDFEIVEPWVRDFEGTAKKKVKKVYWKRVVSAPVRVAFKVGKRVIWKVSTGSWVPLL